MSDLELAADGTNAVEELRRLVGVQLRRKQHNTQASRPAIFRWAKAVGERNPLWLDEGYAARSAFGNIVAPPCWLYTVDDTLIAPRLPGLHSIYAGVDFEFFQWVRLGDQIRASARLVDVQVKQGTFCGPAVMQVGEVLYTNSRGELVARAISNVMRTRRDRALASGKYAEWQKYSYSAAELSKIESSYDAEEIRGSAARYWEDAREGEELRPVVRGPLTSEDMIQFICTTRPVPGFKQFEAYRRRHPAAAFADPQAGGAWEAWEASMLRDDVAQMFGFPFAHDAGIDRISWVGTLLTNWMGDQGFVKRLSLDLLLPNVYGDVTWCRGKVLRKLRQESDGLVEVDVWCENQRGQTTAKGSSTIAVPSRSQLRSVARS